MSNLMRAAIVMLALVFSSLASYSYGSYDGYYRGSRYSSQSLCEFSIYNTSDYDMINGVLYCRSSPNSFQMLKKPTPRSKHLDTHKKDKS